LLETLLMVVLILITTLAPVIVDARKRGVDIMAAEVDVGA
jgi:hypothetical protein